ncbi:MAG: hypothetical protein ACHQYQ_01645 [Bacteriovoracales bacterium]
MKYFIILFLGIYGTSFAKELVCRNQKDQMVDQVGENDFLGGCSKLGDRTILGNGYVQTYVNLNKDGSPRAIGYVFPQETLDNLPPKTVLHDGLHCFDVNGDGVIENNTECAGGHQRFLFLPNDRGNTPINWALLNWNPAGHQPVGVYDHPHFDFHFYIQSFFERNAIDVGPCAGLTNCEVYAKAIKDVPAKYMPVGYINPKAVEAKMGNHLIDPTSHEFDPQHGHHFTHTLVYGSYDGHITFIEPMITLAFLKEKKSECYPIKMATAFEVGGYYPTSYCIRFEGKYYIYLEKFELKKAE